MLAARKSGQAKEPKASSLAYARSNGEIAAGETASMLASGTAQMRPEVRGIELDAQSRCTHYSSPLDIVAIKMKCCGGYFACKECHAALADHVLEPWPREEWQRPAILCGACGTELTIAEYIESSSECPDCGARFNPACREHRAYYFRPYAGAGEL
jgi:uncharacterized CHY-type Zn-finger protein